MGVLEKTDLPEPLKSELTVRERKPIMRKCPTAFTQLPRVILKGQSITAQSAFYFIYCRMLLHTHGITFVKAHDVTKRYSNMPLYKRNCTVLIFPNGALKILNFKCSLMGEKVAQDN